ncbi:hypothetical protein niasHT_004063 [Heterodera trifolii]|uniref:14-3-3 domain-containing protein n=1 Tax=Heterodera trifolii TaxID=157864 RepID=A0ABD2MAD5_9BILA
MAAAETKEELLFLINLCDTAKCFNEMVDAVKKLVSICPELSYEERYLLWVAFKGAMSSIRQPWRALCAIEQRSFSDITEAQRSNSHLLVIESYREELEVELLANCRGVLEFLDATLIPNATTNLEAKVFYLKMKGDYNRYIAEIALGDDRTTAIEETKKSYNQAAELAAQLTPSDPTRLGVALNMSVFYHQILKDVDQALQTTERALEKANAEIKTFKRGQKLHEDSTSCIEMMRENIKLWKPVNPKHAETK